MFLGRHPVKALLSQLPRRGIDGKHSNIPVISSLT
jgi:hypothetical protein